MSGDNGSERLSKYLYSACVSPDILRSLGVSQARFAEVGDPKAQMINLPGGRVVEWGDAFDRDYVGSGGLVGAAALYNIHSEHVDDVRVF